MDRPRRWPGRASASCRCFCWAAAQPAGVRRRLRRAGAALPRPARAGRGRWRCWPGLGRRRPMAGTARRLAGQGWAGLEWAEGLPGTIGGAVFGNAGCYGGDIAGALRRAWLLVKAQAEEWPAERLGFGYRTSVLKATAKNQELRTENPLTSGGSQFSVLVLDRLCWRPSSRCAGPTRASWPSAWSAPHPSASARRPGARRAAACSRTRPAIALAG